jgi:cell division protein ZapA (FtsZ GTPase activity inhibitor)
MRARVSTLTPRSFAPYHPPVGGARTKRVEVRVAGGLYPVQAPATHRAEARIREAARLVSERIDAIAEATGELSSHRLAVMASLDLATELLVAREEDERTRADDAAFRQAVRERAGRLLGLVRAELSERQTVTAVAAGNGGSESRDVDP